MVAPRAQRGALGERKGWKRALRWRCCVTRKSNEDCAMIVVSPILPDQRNACIREPCNNLVVNLGKMGKQGDVAKLDG